MDEPNYNYLVDHITSTNWEATKWYTMNGSAAVKGNRYIYKSLTNDITARIYPSVTRVGYCQVQLDWFHSGYKPFNRITKDVPVGCTFMAYTKLKAELFKHLHKEKFDRESVAKENMKLLTKRFSAR